MSDKRKPSYAVLIKILVLVWAGFISCLIYPKLFNYGIYPRELWGLLGVFTSPFIHGSWEHIIANSTGLIIFGGIFCWVVKGATSGIIMYMIIVQGLLTWVFARQGNHIGASGLVFALFSYLIFIGVFERRLKFILVSLIVMILWGGTIIGILPLSPYISWEAHLFGFIAGFLSAKGRLRKYLG